MEVSKEFGPVGTKRLDGFRRAIVIIGGRRDDMLKTDRTKQRSLGAAQKWMRPVILQDAVNQLPGTRERRMRRCIHIATMVGIAEAYDTARGEYPVHLGQGRVRLPQMVHDRMGHHRIKGMVRKGEGIEIPPHKPDVGHPFGACPGPTRLTLTHLKVEPHNVTRRNQFCPRNRHHAWAAAAIQEPHAWVHMRHKESPVCLHTALAEQLK